MITSKYFKESEFQKCVPPCSLQNMQQSTMDMLDKAREIAGIPFVINSAYRTVEHEKRQGRDGTSSHTLGMAVDIRCNTSRNRFLIVKGLIFSGFDRIGYHPTFMHSDNSQRHDKEVLFNY